MLQAVHKKFLIRSKKSSFVREHFEIKKDLSTFTNIVYYQVGGFAWLNERTRATPSCETYRSNTALTSSNGSSER